MNNFNFGAPVIASLLLLGGCADDPNQIRKVECVGRDKIKPSELTELDKSIGQIGGDTTRKVVQLCGASYDISGLLNRGLGSVANVTIILDNTNSMYTLTQNSKGFILPAEIPKSTPPAKEEALKYSIQK